MSPRPTDLVAADLAAAVADLAPLLLPSLNDDFADSLLLVGRVLGGRPEASAARATSVDASGVDLVLTVEGREEPARVDYAEPLAVVEGLTPALLELVTRAREQSGDGGRTAAERQAEAAARIRTFLTHVHEVRDLSPHLRQVTFKGGDLTTFEPCGPDTFLYLLLPPPGRSELTIDQSFTWEHNALTDPAEQPVGAYYTLRRWRPESAELDILMVLHGDAGPASAWALRAAPGDPVALWGPRTAYEPPAATEHLVLVADETGLPAVAVILEQLPAGWTATVVAEVADEEERQELPVGPGIDVTVLYRGAEAPGTTSLLVDAVRGLPPFAPGTYVWGGAESRAMTAVRRHVRDERGLEREEASLVAYWRAPGSPPDTEE